MYLTSDPTPDPNLLTPLISHPSLSYLSPPARRKAATVIFKNQFIKLTNLQLAWHEGILEVFTQTQSQTGDEDLMRTWESQVRHITALHRAGLSMIPGVVDIPMATLLFETQMEAAAEEHDVVFMGDRDIDSDTSSLEGENDDVVPGLLHQLDLVDIIAAVDPTTLDI